MGRYSRAMDEAQPNRRILASEWLFLVLIVSLIAPQPVRAQFGIDWGAIVAAITAKASSAMRQTAVQCRVFLFITLARFVISNNAPLTKRRSHDSFHRLPHRLVHGSTHWLSI